MSPEGVLALTHDPFATILSPRKHKAYTEVFSVFTGRPRGNDPNHVILGNAGLTIAKRVLHPPEVKQKVDDTLDMSKAVVAPVGHPDMGPNPGWGEENVLAMFRPLLSSPEVMLVQEEEELDLSDIDNLSKEVIDHIQMKARDKAAFNREHTEKGYQNW